MGSYVEGPLFASHGFLLTNDGTLTTIDVPGGGTRVDSSGQDSCEADRGDVHRQRWFPVTWLRRGSTFTAPISEALNTPVCECQGIPMGINSRGDVVGLYYDAIADLVDFC